MSSESNSKNGLKAEEKIKNDLRCLSSTAPDDLTAEEAIIPESQVPSEDPNKSRTRHESRLSQDTLVEDAPELLPQEVDFAGQHDPDLEENTTTIAGVEEIGQNAIFDPDWRFYLAFTTLSTITLVAAIDATSLSVSLAIIADELGGTGIQAFWAGTSFLLTSTVFQPSFASFSHILGRKVMVFIALGMFAVGAVVCGG